MRKDLGLGLIFLGTGVLGGVTIAVMTGLPFMKAIDEGLSCIIPGCSTDLAAQRSMAIAAWSMVLVTSLSIVVGAVTLAVVYWTLREARRTADAAEITVAVTREIGQQQVRAYLSVGAARLDLGGDGRFPAIHLELANSGQSPAIRVSANLEVTLHLQGIEVVSLPPSYLPDVAAHATFSAVIPLGTNWFELHRHDHYRLQLRGAVKYRDVFRNWDTAEVRFHLARGVHGLDRTLVLDRSAAEKSA